LLPPFSPWQPLRLAFTRSLNYKLLFGYDTNILKTEKMGNTYMGETQLMHYQREGGSPECVRVSRHGHHGNPELVAN
jgi:hypothetical protein